MTPTVAVNGTCDPRFSAVRDNFERNFTHDNEVGAAVAVWVEGDLVVNLWGGYADARRRRPWRENTLASVFSGTKGLTSTCIHLLADRGEIDLDAPVAQYWPEFAQAGKQDITVAMVLGHRSGLIAPRTRMHWSEVTEWDRVCDALAASEPWWEPGTAQGYHMVAFGFVLGEVVRRVTGRTLGQYLRTEIAEPMGIDVHIGLPVSEHHRCADMINKPHIRNVLANGGAPGDPTSLDEHPMAGLSIAMGFVPDDELGSNDLTTWRSAEFPGTNAHVSALGLATFYNGLAQEKLLTRERLTAARVSQGGFDPDVVLGPRVADGSYGFVDLEHGIGDAYVMNYFDATKCNADPRTTALSDEVYRVLGAL